MGERRSAAGTVAGDSPDDNDAVATSDLVVRRKDPVFGGVDFSTFGISTTEARR